MTPRSVTDPARPGPAHAGPEHGGLAETVHRAYVALGANLGDTEGTLRSAIAAIGALPGTRLVAQSSFHRTAPVGYLDQPEFLNAVVAIDTALPPLALLDALQSIENAHGRRRSFPNAPRTLDLDLLLHGETVLADARLVLPHPRMHTRGFVLAPLAEIAPDAVVPGHGEAKALLAALGTSAPRTPGAS